jgi:hypothetical protein
METILELLCIRVYWRGLREMSYRAADGRAKT